MATATQNLVGVDASIVPVEEWVGSYFWYSIPKDSIALTRARKAFKDAGLDPAMLPTERRGEHVAMDACSSVQGVRSNGHREEIHADKVVRDGHFLIYQITRHVWDEQNRLIEHPKALRVLYDFESESLSFEALGGASIDEVAHLRDEIQTYYDKHGSRLSGHNFRTILRHYVEAAGAENMRGQSGGIYFLPQTNRLSDMQDPKSGEYYHKLRGFHGPVIKGDEFIAQVKAALTAIYGRAPEWHRIPCINDEEQREFLKRKFLENCAEDLKTYRDECLELVKSKKEGQRIRGFRSDKRDGMIRRRVEMDERRKKFAEILGETLEELDRDMSLADKALAKFISEADAA